MDLNRSQQVRTGTDQTNPAFDLIDLLFELINLPVELLQAFLHCWESRQEVHGIDQLLLLLWTELFNGVTLHFRYHGLQHFNLGVLQKTEACSQKGRHQSPTSRPCN